MGKTMNSKVVHFQTNQEVMQGFLHESFPALPERCHDMLLVSAKTHRFSLVAEGRGVQLPVVD